MSTSNQNFSKKSTVPKLRFEEFKDAWLQKKVGDVCKIKHGFAFKGEYFDDSGPYIVLTPGNFDVENGGFRYQGEKEKYYTDDNFPKEYILSKGDLLTVMTEQAAGLIGCPLIIPKSGVFLHNQRLGLFQVSPKVKREFLFHIMQTKGVSEKFSKTAAGTKVRHTSPQLIEGIVISIPHEDEQQKIASFLSAVDEKIQQLTRKKELLEQYKKGAMQQLFSGKLRFKDENGEPYPKWQVTRLGDEVEEFAKKSTINDEFIVLTSSNKGLVKQSDYYGENRLTERENIGFNVIPENHITYRSRSDNRQFTFNVNNLGITGIVSTYYPVFFSKKSDPRFIATLLNFYKHRVGAYSVGTSQTVLSYNELKKIKFHLPSLQEQKKVVSFLTELDAKIASVATKMTNTQTFKKGLLQQMFV